MSRGLLAVVFAVACGSSPQPSAHPHVSVSNEPAGSNCPQGGERIDVTTGSTVTTSYICNGADGSAATVTVTTEPAGSHCPAGGVAITSTSSQATQISYICNPDEDIDGSDCAPGQVIGWTGSDWACTTVAAGTGTGTTNSLAMWTGSGLGDSPLSYDGSSTLSTANSLAIGGNLTLSGSGSPQGQQLLTVPNGLWVQNVNVGMTQDLKTLDMVLTPSMDTSFGPLIAVGGGFDNRTTKLAGTNLLTNYGIYASAQNGDVNYSGYFDHGSFIVNGPATMSTIGITGQSSLGYGYSITNVETARTTPQMMGVMSQIAGSSDTTDADKSNYGVSAIASAQRAAGANDVINYGVYASALGGQQNFSGFFDQGTFQVQNQSIFNGPMSITHQPVSVAASGSVSASSVRIGGPTGPVWSTGTGNPNGSVIGSVGDMYTRLDGGNGSTLYVKESGSGTSIGWIAK
jgi:hypothetical protein